jgi:hypothetical protein
VGAFSGAELIKKSAIYLESSRKEYALKQRERTGSIVKTLLNARFRVLDRTGNDGIDE